MNWPKKYRTRTRFIYFDLIGLFNPWTSLVLGNELQLLDWLFSVRCWLFRVGKIWNHLKINSISIWIWLWFGGKKREKTHVTSRHVFISTDTNHIFSNFIHLTFSFNIFFCKILIKLRTHIRPLPKLAPQCSWN